MTEDYKRTRPKIHEYPDDFAVDVELLRMCRRAWMNIAWYKSISSDNTLVKVSVVKSHIKSLDEQAQRQGLSQLYYAPDSGKRKLDEGPTSVAKKPRFASPISEGARRRLDEGSMHSAVLEILDKPVCPASTDPNVVLCAPRLPQAKDLVALATGESTSDTIVDPYLALLCHKGNGHFDGDDGFQRLGSPQWFTWSAWIAKAIATHRDTEKAVFPPQTYPEGTLENVWHHIFPVHLGRERWAMFILTRASDGMYKVDVYSSVADYRSRELLKMWPLIGEWLRAKDQGLYGVSDLVPTWPPQLEHDSEVDGGVLMCCTLRWLIEGWPLPTLQHGDIKMLRRRMVRELENWTLSL